MGCGRSKDTGVDVPEDFVPKTLTDKDLRPDKLRREITEIYASYNEKKEQIKPLLTEKHGVEELVEEEREKLVEILQEKEKLDNERKPMMEQIWKKDADDIYSAFGRFSVDKDILVRILAARPKWQILLIGEAFEQKYGIKLLEKVVNELTTLVGTLLTGSGTGLSRLLIYRIMNQPERDAALLRDFSDGMSLEDENLMEIVCTRTNAELKAAMKVYDLDYKKSLRDIIKSKASYKNYREFVLKILECDRDENNKPFDEETALELAKELHKGEANSYIEILANCNSLQIDSLQIAYKKLNPGKDLKKDICNKIGGDFRLAVMTRCTDKYEYLATRLDEAIKGWSVDNESICRILGCLSRGECVQVKLAFNRMGPKRNLEETIKTVLKSQPSYQVACLTLMSEDTSLTPLGSDKEDWELEVEVSREGERAQYAASQAYRTQFMKERGEAILRQRETDRKNKELEEKSDEIAFRDEEERVLGFRWDAHKGKFLDGQKLTAKYRELEYVEHEVSLMKERLGDEIIALKDVWLSILKTRVESEAWIRIHSSHVKSMKTFIARRETLSGGRPGISKQSSIITSPPRSSNK